MPTQIVSVQDGPRLTVNELTKAPTVIPRRILSMMDNQFLVDDVLRPASDAPGGSVLYHESTPLYTADDPAILDEFGEIPITSGSLGVPLVARVVRRALGLRVSKTMIDRNDVDAVNIQVVQIRNTMVRAWEDALFSAIIANASVQVVQTDVAWGASGSHIRADVNAAKYLIKMAAADAAGKQKFGYVADTLIISVDTESDFLNSNEVSTPYVGNIADENLKYTGKLPNKFLGLDVLVSWRLSAYFVSGAIVCQRKIFGGISNERPLQATPLYGEGGGPNGGPRESWRTDTTRASAIFIDQPKAVVLIAGVNGGTQTYSVGGRSITLAAGTATTYPTGGVIVR
jgi:hypothetical protein